MSGPGIKRTRPWQGTKPGEAAGRLDAADELFTLVTFDLSDDKARRKVGETCKDYGLRRLQWSVFEGPMTRNRREELSDRLTLILEQAEGGGKLAIFPVGAREATWATRLTTRGQPVSTAPSAPRLLASGDEDAER